MSRLCTYVVVHDTGLAPNPFWGWCTLAVCTPNHQGAKLKPGDWIAGFLNREADNRFLYAMEISECLDMDDYFADPRFINKRPRVRGTWMERCGDNFYSLDESGRWIQHETLFHTTRQQIEADTRYARVFAARKFWYLGKEAHPLPDCFRPLVGTQGTRIKRHPPGLTDQFRLWVEQSFREGVSALPRDIQLAGCSTTC